MHPASKSPIVPIGNVVGKYGALLLFTELLLYVGDLEGFDEGLNVAIEHLRQLVECEIDAVIGDAVLRIIVGSDFR